MTSSTLDKAKDKLADSTGTDDDADDRANEPIVEGSGQAAAFDRSQYELEGLQIPKVDGEAIDKIRLKFAGSVMLDRSSEADVAMFNRLRLGQDVELRVSAKVTNSGGAGFTTNREGDLDSVVGTKALVVDSVWVLEPENL